MKKDLSEQAKEARREYYRQWRKKNRQKIKMYEQVYWEKLADKGKEADDDKQ